MITFAVLLALISLLIATDSCDQSGVPTPVPPPPAIRQRTAPAVAATASAAATILLGGCTAVPVPAEEHAARWSCP